MYAGSFRAMAGKRNRALKLRSSDFTTITAQRGIDPTNDDTVVSRVARELLHSSYTANCRFGFGVRLSHVR